MTLPLTGKTIAVAEGRQIEELTQLLEKEGATTLRYPLLSILDAPDPGSVLTWIEELIAGHFDLLVLMTGEGVRRLVSFAEQGGRREDFVQALARVPTLTRGPKPGQALKEIGLAPTEIAATPVTAGVIARLAAKDLNGRTVGVQLAAVDNPPLLEALSNAGARARPVIPYVYAPKSDTKRVSELIGHMASGRLDAIVFTSAPQVDRLCEVATEEGLAQTLNEGWKRTCVAAVGPVVAENLHGRGVHVDVCPEQGWQMKNLVRQVVKTLTSPRIDS